MLVWLALIRPMRNFAGGNCSDTEQELLTSPDGKRTPKRVHRVCGSDGRALYSGYSLFLKPEIRIEDTSTRPSRVFGTWVLMLYPCRGTARTKSRCAIHLQGSWKMYMRRCWESGW